MNSKKINKQLSKVTKNEVACSTIINKFVQNNNLNIKNFTTKDYQKILKTLQVEEFDDVTMLKLVERFK